MTRYNEYDEPSLLPAKRAWEKLGLPLDWHHVVTAVRKQKRLLWVTGLSTQDVLERIPGHFSLRIERGKFGELLTKHNVQGFIYRILHNIIIDDARVEGNARRRREPFEGVEDRMVGRSKAHEKDKQLDASERLREILSPSNVPMLTNEERAMLNGCIEYMSENPNKKLNLDAVYRRMMGPGLSGKPSAISARASRLFRRALYKIRVENGIIAPPAAIKGLPSRRPRIKPIGGGRRSPAKR
jgi:hypothetical protein